MLKLIPFQFYSDMYSKYFEKTFSVVNADKDETRIGSSSLATSSFHEFKFNFLVPFPRAPSEGCQYIIPSARGKHITCTPSTLN